MAELDEADEYDAREQLDALIDALAEPDCRFPVLVTIHHDHLLWVEGESRADALRNLQNDGEWYEHLNDHETLLGAWEEMREPARYDRVYEGGDSMRSLDCREHVESHLRVLRAAERAEEKAACKAAGHPELKVYAGSRPTGTEAYCKTCGYIALDVLVEDLRAVARG